MIDHGNPETNAAEPPVDPALGEIVEQITRRLEAGECVNAEDLSRLSPACAGPIRRLLPTLRTMVSLGRTVARDRRRIKHPDFHTTEPDGEFEI